RHAASFAAGKGHFSHHKNRAWPSWLARFFAPGLTGLAQIKKSCTSGLFWGLASHNIDLSIFGRT
ncbi:MAG TPA: hypothetical protein VF957_03570, partial [Bradyrhizobium sp.]